MMNLIQEKSESGKSVDPVSLNDLKSSVRSGSLIMRELPKNLAEAKKFVKEDAMQALANGNRVLFFADKSIIKQLRAEFGGNTFIANDEKLDLSKEGLLEITGEKNISSFKHIYLFASRKGGLSPQTLASLQQLQNQLERLKFKNFFSLYMISEILDNQRLVEVTVQELMEFNRMRERLIAIQA
jgi:hypothetical protein